MVREEFVFQGHHQASLSAIIWLPEGKIRAILQITHGMTEHMGRYEEFARDLTDQGIAVAGFDLRGHGKNPGDPSVASFGEGGWEASIEDMRLFFELLEHRFPQVPHFMQGFSLGSFLLREYLGTYPDGIAGAILMGTGNQPGWLLKLMMRIVMVQIRKVGFDGYSPLVRQLSFGVYNQNFKPNRTEKDWLCADAVQLDGYLADPLCRENFSAGLFYQMLASMKRTGSKNGCDGWKNVLPVLLICGEMDPVGNMGKGSVQVHRQLTAAGLNTEFHLLPGARHMVLSEKACGAGDQALNIIRNWLDARIRN